MQVHINKIPQNHNNNKNNNNNSKRGEILWFDAF